MSPPHLTEGHRRYSRPCPKPTQQIRAEPRPRVPSGCIPSAQRPGECGSSQNFGEDPQERVRTNLLNVETLLSGWKKCFELGAAPSTAALCNCTWENGSFSGPLPTPLSVSSLWLSSSQPAAGQCEVPPEAGSKIPIAQPGACRVPGEAALRVLRGGVFAQEAGRGRLRAGGHPAVPSEGTGRPGLCGLPACYWTGACP